MSKAELFAENTPGLDISQRFALETIAKYIPSIRKREDFQNRVSMQREAGETNLEHRARYHLDVARREVAERNARAAATQAKAAAPSYSRRAIAGAGQIMSASSNRGQVKAMVRQLSLVES